MAVPRKALGTVGDGLVAKGNVEVDFPFGHIEQRRGHGVLKLDHQILPGGAGLDGNAVAGLVRRVVHQADVLRARAGEQGVARLVQNFDMDEFH